MYVSAVLKWLCLTQREATRTSATCVDGHRTHDDCHQSIPSAIFSYKQAANSCSQKSINAGTWQHLGKAVHFGPSGTLVHPTKEQKLVHLSPPHSQVSGVSLVKGCHSKRDGDGSCQLSGGAYRETWRCSYVVPSPCLSSRERGKPRCQAIIVNIIIRQKRKELFSSTFRTSSRYFQMSRFFH